MSNWLLVVGVVKDVTSGMWHLTVDVQICSKCLHCCQFPEKFEDNVLTTGKHQLQWSLFT